MILIGLVFAYLFTYFDWNIVQGMIIGAIMSATDTVAVISILTQLDAPKKIAVLLEGESLFNDGISFVSFEVLVKAVTNINSFWDIIVTFIQLSILGPLWGLLIALILVNKQVEIIR